MEQARRPMAGDLYRHFKDRLYEIITIAIHSETGEEMVVYKQLYGEFQIYVRPLSMFLSEVDHEKYPDIKQKYRFELVREEKKKEVPDEFLMKFLDAKGITEKYKILDEYAGELDNRMINNLAISVDIVIDEGPIEQRLSELKDCLRTKARFECSRLR
ncbi:MAG: DUF1653 domain-containing protein [Velocimicrobium sp.]